MHSDCTGSERNLDAGRKNLDEPTVISGTLFSSLETHSQMQCGSADFVPIDFAPAAFGRAGRCQLPARDAPLARSRGSGQRVLPPAQAFRGVTFSARRANQFRFGEIVSS